MYNLTDIHPISFLLPLLLFLFLMLSLLFFYLSISLSLFLSPKLDVED